ncbi:MAG TPA: RagB/SusD family nutrient uptake outer membrane protein [Candidatus Caccoplasma merdavium]|nr:RagB/SusD family nutrient uptake outer membrane protein [Candidatus Caccoplasma merdavium]
MKIKNIKYAAIALGFGVMLSTTACKDWLEVYPENSQPSITFWQTKADVDAVLNAGYYYLRDMVVPYLIPWGELRAGCVYASKGSKLQEFQVKPTDKDLCTWCDLYEIINVANAVIKRAPDAQKVDDTYQMSEMLSHQSEAYFLRALCYFYIVRNWRDAPLITEPYEDDSYATKVPKAGEAEIIAQIREDIRTALATGAAKESFDTAWETKGRATKWALYALGADVCLWAEDYEAAITYCDGILESNSPYAPAFLSTPTHSSWFSMFNPGNSNESIFELQWNYEEEQTNTLPKIFDDVDVDANYCISLALTQEFGDEYTETLVDLKEAVRTMYGGYYVSDPTTYESATVSYVWKYLGSQTLSDKRTVSYYDPNYIIYRVADVMLMKAEALILRSHGENDDDKAAAMALINQIRTRSNLEIEYEATPVGVASLDEASMLELVLYERTLELVGEGKAWYDFLRFGRRNNNEYKELFLVNNVLKYNTQAGESWLRTVLNNDNALFLPISQTEIEANDLLIQNPYYN